MKKYFQRFFGGLKGMLYLAAALTAATLYLYSQSVIHELREESRVLVQFYAQMVAKVADTESSEDIDFIFNEIILRTKFPLIYTDSERKPAEWKGLPVEPGDRSPEGLQQVEQILKRMMKESEPVEVRYQETVLGFLYYGDSGLIRQLQWLPYVQSGFIGVFILVGFLGYANIKRSEQRHIWVGMAKETAHQLGTPLSSLMGWVELLKTRRRSIDRILTDMERDVSRLEQVTKRFSQIGSRPALKETDLRDVVEKVVDYIRRRAPQTGRHVVIQEKFDPVPAVALNPEIFQWAVENLLKNSLDAMDKKEGRIEVRLGKLGDGKHVYLEVEDNGRGMDKKAKRHLFKPGFSTKKRGWGLGLSLAKRIIEEYHGGVLFIKDTRPGHGTTMRMELRHEK